MASNPANLPSCSVPNDAQHKGLPLIHGENLGRSFHGKESIVALSQLSFGIEEGNITAIIGESGSGKSTLLRLIYGLLEPDVGEIRYRGWKVPTPKEKLIPGHDAMRMVSQGFDDLNTYANVWDNVASQLSNTDLKAKQEKTEKILKQLRIDHLAKQRVADLSGGEKQRVAISRALVNEPEVLLLDEPFNQVDASFRDKLQLDIRKIVAETGLTVLLVSHDPLEVLALADNLLVLRGGNLVAQGAPAMLYERPPNAYTAQLLAQSNILNSKMALELGIQANGTIVVHPEWVTLHEEANARFSVLDVRYKGFYEELTVGSGQLRLRVISLDRGKFAKGTRVAIDCTHFHKL